MSVIFIKEKNIKHYDSLGGYNWKANEALLDYLKNEAREKNVAFDINDWTADMARNCPKQENGFDCGVFICLVGEFLSRKAALTFTQAQIQNYRQKIITEMRDGKLIMPGK